MFNRIYREPGQPYGRVILDCEDNCKIIFLTIVGWVVEHGGEVVSYYFIEALVSSRPY